MDDASKKILSRLQNQCARREYCSSEILRKAATAFAAVGGTGPERVRLRDEPKASQNVVAKGRAASAAALAEEILASLVADGYVDDLRYATAFARDKAALGGWGPVKIRYALRAKRIDSSTIDAALQEIEPEKALGKLERLLAAKRRTLEGDPQIKMKLMRYALSRGYEYDDVRRLLDD